MTPRRNFGIRRGAPPPENCPSPENCPLILKGAERCPPIKSLWAENCPPIESLGAENCPPPVRIKQAEICPLTIIHWAEKCPPVSTSINMKCRASSSHLFTANSYSIINGFR
ncbi:hypothetical protein DPMN_148628 [Dreissena polymorpha]|uniref:Uncharacterized protein n=1 Tax=Dreissena polymorpha TaxID=45954 RepID=A0A9D4FAB3_DREPO|nr:hypothetical protein DPMN_148628 [Dreissena polymorpha]